MRDDLHRAVEIVPAIFDDVPYTLPVVMLLSRVVWAEVKLVVPEIEVGLPSVSVT
jgi:hypothetical protein